MGIHASVYALYKGDKFLDIGTKRELAERHNVKLTTMDFLAKKANLRRRKGNGLLIIKIGSVDDDLEAKDDK